MRYALGTAVAVLLLAPSAMSAAAQPQPTRSSAADIVELRALNARWLDSYRTGDANAVGKILAPDFVTTMPSGRKLDRAATLRGVSPDARVLAIRWDDVDVRVFGDSAIVTGRCSFDDMRDGATVTTNTRYTDVYVRRQGRWLAVAAHVSRLP